MERRKAVLGVLAIIAKEDPQVIFLGGSAIQALLPAPRRLSIDLDISISGRIDSLITALEMEGYRISKRSSALPEFQFFNLTKRGVLVKLDIGNLTIASTDTRTIGEEQIKVKIPSIDYLLASKLSALALGTVGRVHEEPSQVIKDIYDINCLLDLKSSLKDINENLQQIISDQSRFRRKRFREVDCMQSIQATLLKCVGIDHKQESYISKLHLGSFQDTLVEGKLLRADFSRMAARTLLLIAFMGDEFYEVEQEAINKAKEKNVLQEVEKSLSASGLLPAEELKSIKIVSPISLMYLNLWLPKKRGDNPLTT